MKLFISLILVLFILAALKGYFSWSNEWQGAIWILVALGILGNLWDKRRR